MTWSKIDFHPTERKLRQFTWLLFFAVLAMIAFWQGWRREDWIRSSGIVFTGLLFLVLGSLRPGAVRPIYLGMTLATFPIGWVMSQLLLALAYFGMFTPIALLFRALGRDALELRPNYATSSYLKPRPKAGDDSSYLRPY